MIYENKFPESTLKTLDSFFADGRTPHAILIDGGSEKDRIEIGRNEKTTARFKLISTSY